MDERGRLLLPASERRKIGLKPGEELEVIERGGVLVLKPVIPRALKVRAGKGKWGREAFLDAGEATFGG